MLNDKLKITLLLFSLLFLKITLTVFSLPRPDSIGQPT